MKLKQETIVNHIDTSTGEIYPVTTSKTYSIKVKSEDFYMTFINSCSSIFQLKSNIDLKLIIKLCCIAEFNTGKIYLPSQTRKELCDSLEIVNQQLSNSLASLKKKGLITGEKGVFTINPTIFWKGSFDHRKDLMTKNNLKVTIEIE